MGVSFTPDNSVGVFLLVEHVSCSDTPIVKIDFMGVVEFETHANRSAIGRYCCTSFLKVLRS
jgi:hypothetical protein